jgi:hypothetical protein
MGFGRRKKHILVVSNVGQANEQRLKLLLEEVCRIKGNGYQRNADEYESEKYYFKVYFNTDGANQDRIGILIIIIRDPCLSYNWRYNISYKRY